MTVPSDAAIGERGARRRAREPATRRGLRERTPRLRRLRRSRAQSPRRREANRSPRESSNAHPTLSTRRGRRNTSTIQYIVLTLVFVYDATGHPARGNPAYTFDWRDSVAEFRSFGWEGYLYYDILPPRSPEHAHASLLGRGEIQVIADDGGFAVVMSGVVLREITMPFRALFPCCVILPVAAYNTLDTSSRFSRGGRTAHARGRRAALLSATRRARAALLGASVFSGAARPSARWASPVARASRGRLVLPLGSRRSCSSR